jgi:hypothetical protein
LNAKKTLSLLIFFCMVTPSVFGVLPGGPLPLVSATSSNQTGTGTAPGTPLAPGTVTYQNTVNDTPKIVQKSVASLPSFEFNSTGLYWGSGNDSMELQLPILTIATSTATCATLESATLTHNSTTYTYSFAGASACSGLALTISYNLYVNNLTGTDNKEVSVIGTIDKVGSGSFNNIISFPLTLPSNFVLNTNSDSVNAGSVGFNWQDMSSFSPTWNGTTNSIDVSTGSSSAGIVKFSIDPTLVQSQSDACSSNSCSASFGSSVTAGDTIVAIAGFEYGSGYPSFSITDNSGDTFNVARQEYYGCCVGTAIWYATDVVGGSVTVTDSVTGGAGTLYNNGIFIYEISPSILGNTAVGVGASLNPATSSMSFGSNSILFSGVSAGGTAQYIAKDGTSWSYMYVLASTSHGDGTAGGAYSTTASSPTTFEWTLPYYAEAYAAVGVEFQAAPVPSATISSPSWSKAGLSPFENYFTGESEYVSPGNGLLGIEQTDYSLAGKGLDLAITRVYSQPYAFIANSPYLYDNYTLSNLGLGWQLNFPWMGADYLHLSDGEVYQYNWTGNSFLNSLGTPFVLLNNSGSYDLHLVSGIDYHFNSAKQLESITDSTGNNTITFSYGTNGYISKITDTASRNITFTYNGNDQLSTVATWEGNFYYNYSGDNLVSVTDPAGRVTGYNYSTGINDWLVSSISYPTGAHTNYTYNSSSYGVEKIYYVTSQNIYVQGTTRSTKALPTITTLPTGRSNTATVRSPTAQRLRDTSIMYSTPLAKAPRSSKIPLVR